MDNLHDGWKKVQSENSQKIRVWLQNLVNSTCSDNEQNASTLPSVLFIIDNDYGELTTILYLISGVNSFSKFKILLSKRIYEHNYNTFPSNVESWSSEEDLLQSLKLFRPDIVMLASGYLIPIHNLLSIEALERVCKSALNQGAKVITADPFLGLLSQWSPIGLEKIISIDIPIYASKELLILKQAADKKLHVELSLANTLLRNFPHIYPAYTDMQEIHTYPTDVMNRSFFNENLLIPKEYLSEPRGSKPHWVFVISEVDFQTQAMHQGVEPFAEIVLNLLIQGADLGRKVIFLGPKSLIDLLYPMTNIERGNKDIHLFNFGAYECVMSLLLSAEYCFYWNVVSHTILMQLWNGRPVILFDKGHLARSVPDLYERVIAWYYQGWEPEYVDQHKAISLERLIQIVNSHGTIKEKLMNAYKRAPSPEYLFRSLLEGSSPI